MSGGEAEGAKAGGEQTHAQVLVLGGGPGGYTAAFRAADLGLDVVLVERHETLGGVCLNVGCIPSKALLHLAKVITDAERASELGISFAAPQVDLSAVRRWKEGVVSAMNRGLAGLARERKVTVVRGEGRIVAANTLEVAGHTISFENAILATGSRAVRLPGIPHEHPRVMDSTDALTLEEIPRRLLVVGGGIIGLELASVYDALGSQVTIAELTDRLIPECDPDLVAPLRRRIAERYAAIHLRTAVAAIEPTESSVHVTFAPATAQSGEADGGTPRDPDSAEVPPPAEFDRVLLAVGRVPNSSSSLGLERAGVAVEERGFVTVDSRQRTSAPHIYAIGDLTGAPMLAHKATHEARVAAEVIAGADTQLDVRGIPSVAYTDPEVAWVGLTETEAARTGAPCRRVAVRWSASGRALASSAGDGLTKLLVDPATNRLLGAGIVGVGAGELIAETGLALELESDTEDIALTVHAHPTLMETIALAAEAAEGTVTDLPRASR